MYTVLLEKANEGRRKLRRKWRSKGKEEAIEQMLSK